MLTAKERTALGMLSTVLCIYSFYCFYVSPFFGVLMLIGGLLIQPFSINTFFEKTGKKWLPLTMAFLFIFSSNLLVFTSIYGY